MKMLQVKSQKSARQSLTYPQDSDDSGSADDTHSNSDRIPGP